MTDMRRTRDRDPARGARPPRPSTRRLWIVAPLAALAASVINAGLFSIGDAFGAFPADVLTPAGAPITLGAVLALTIAGVVGSAVAYAVLGRTVRRPVRAFVLVAVVVFALMIGPPFMLSGAPTVMIAMLQALHLTTALVAVGAMLRFATTRRP